MVCFCGFSVLRSTLALSRLCHEAGSTVSLQCLALEPCPLVRRSNELHDHRSCISHTIFTSGCMATGICFSFAPTSGFADQFQVDFTMTRRAPLLHQTSFSTRPFVLPFIYDCYLQHRMLCSSGKCAFVMQRQALVIRLPLPTSVATRPYVYGPTWLAQRRLRSCLVVEDRRACWLCSGFQHDSYLQQHVCVPWCHHLCPCAVMSAC